MFLWFYSACNTLSNVSSKGKKKSNPAPSMHLTITLCCYGNKIPMKKQKWGAFHCESCIFCRYLFSSPLQIQMNVMQHCSKHHILPSSIPSLTTPPRNVGKHFKMLLEILKQEAEAKLDSSIRRMVAQINSNELLH